MDIEVMLVRSRRMRIPTRIRVNPFVVILVLLFLSSTFGFGQHYLVRRYAEREGLPSSQVFDMLQDPMGRMWFATQLGISCYDGVSWRHHGNREGLPVLIFYKLAIDGTRWQSIDNVRALNARISLPTSFSVMDRGEMGTPNLAVGTMVDGLFLWNGKKWEQFSQTNGLSSNSISGIEILNGKFYVATDKGLNVLSQSLAGTFHVDHRLTKQLGDRLPLISRPLKGIGIQFKDKFLDARLPNARIWVYGGDQLGYFDESGHDVAVYPVPVRFKDTLRTVRIQPDYRSGLYVGNMYEVYYFNTRTGAWNSIGVTNGLLCDGANAMAIDFEKNIWISCYHGVSCITSRRFSNFRAWNGMLEDEVTAILEYHPGQFILGHTYGVTYYDTRVPGKGGNFQKLPFFSPGAPQIPLCRVLDMQIDSQKNIWLACARAGLAKINPQRQVTWYGKKDGLPENIICLWIDHLDNMLVGTERGIYRGGENGFHLQPLGPFSHISVRRIYSTGGKIRLLASNDSGIYVYQEKEARWKHYWVSNDRDANAVYAIKEEANGWLWLGTRGGLFVLEPGQEFIHRFEKKGFRIERPIYSILADSKKQLWFGTNNGLVCWDGNQAREYSMAEGLTGNESNRAAAMMDRDGRLWFGTNRGLSIYDPAFDGSLRYCPPPRVRLLHVEVDDMRIPLDKPIRLKNKQNSLVIHFRGISFMDQKAVLFKSRLEGLEGTWSAEKNLGNQTIRYTDLVPGTYRFHLKAKNLLGVWSDAVQSPEIIILRPFYWEWWFFALLFLIVMVVIYSFIRFFNQQRYALILEKKVAERSIQLQAAAEQYRNLFEESEDGVFMNTSDGVFIDINPAGVRLFGYDSKAELLSLKSIATLYENPDDRQKYKEKIEKEGFVKDYEIAFLRKDGQRIITRVTASLVRDKNGNITAYRGIIRDITAQKELEQQLMQAQKMEAIGTLAGGIAHDFNNILGVIVGFTELALEDLEEGSLVYQNIHNVLTAAERASELVKQILAFSRQSERKRKPISLGQVVQESLKLLRSSLPATIQIHRDIQADTAPILGDASQIHQIMMNLCTNAGFAMKKNGGILEVVLREVQLDQDSVTRYTGLPPGRYLRLTVSDTGSGIPQNVIKRIFDPYFTTKKAGEGTGMGLAVIHGIIKSHGGDITVYSEVNKGTTFNVLLPCFEGDAESKTEVHEEVQTGNERILLVDDEEALTRVGSQILRRLGYTVTGISNPLDALRLFRHTPQDFDVVITDLTMPHMTGIQLARELKNIKHDIPVILCSGFSTITTRRKFKAYGVNEFVMKPVIRNDLARAVRKVLDKKDD